MKNTELFTTLAKQLIGVECAGCGNEVEPTFIEFIHSQVIGYTCKCGIVVLRGRVLGSTR